MCYEKFMHSAADAYLRSMRRARMQRGEVVDDKPQPTNAPARKGPASPSLSSLWKDLPWQDLKDTLREIGARYKRVFLYIGIALLVGVGVQTLLDPQTRARLFGLKLAYTPQPSPLNYLAGFQHTVDIRANRNTGDMYTPVDMFTTNELTNVRIEKGRVRIPNLLLSIRRENRANDVVIAESHPTAQPMAFKMDADGNLTIKQRSAALRTNRVGEFVLPILPNHRIKPGQAWTEKVAWIDIAGDWRIRWDGQRRWQFEEIVPCGNHSCARLTYEASMTPRLFGRPSWMSRGKETAAVTAGRGEALFDLKTKTILSHTLTYAATIRATMANIGVIPYEKRVGSRTFNAPGELILELRNKIAVTKKSTPSET